ncbi:hypothetical protein BO79DRAFT_259838 [Aspergillus costaricaensis CBS 115574]|uniref:Uncharacterized protein n=1 Tax=Aspergillus costaricaensis CBS 115574 TaxID=1448317 RepID=A0ACD1I0V1_9EURO|nr:hypothetical protein BO79DRAFT_259838 [Aspergillus costaricaensis CBS 115574]RAK83849.1 hypothetical protein BO79DRAFT_259838 [Aspergillus costaricaensis CBS 115574]
MSSPANTTNASDADEATSNNNETTEPLSVTFAGPPTQYRKGRSSRPHAIDIG